MSQCLRLHLEIDFGVDICCIEGYMAKPGADGVDINTGTQEVNSRCMPDSVCTNLLCE